jgi:ESCRT-I complex subunit VPS28
MNLDEEVRLPTTPAERERTENLATLYSIIVSLEYLERAYVRDSVSSKEYAPACTRLLAQYKSVMKIVGEDIGGVEVFMKRYRVSLSAHEGIGTICDYDYA